VKSPSYGACANESGHIINRRFVACASEIDNLSLVSKQHDIWDKYKSVELGQNGRGKCLGQIVGVVDSDNLDRKSKLAAE
jgi:hypothetical protein